MSHLAMPPKMLTRIALTLVSEVMMRNASVTRAAFAVPPTSRKFAGRRAVQLDDVHRRHGQARAVHHAADLAIERDVVQVVLDGVEFLRVHLAVVAQRLEVLVAVQRVVVEGHLGVERHDVALAGHHQRVDLDDRAVELEIGAVQRGHELREGGDLLAFQAEPEGQLARNGSRRCRRPGRSRPSGSSRGGSRPPPRSPCRPRWRP